MASKFGLAGGIPERRIRPIWDAIDSRQFKNALKLVTSLLSKFPNSPYALALKALVLERMGKSDEAFTVCLSAKDFLHKNDAVSMDDLTLSTLQIVFQRLDHLDLATSCYEYACGKFPNNLDLMIGLFNCYVREYSFVKQQQTAIKMYKIASEERFLLWAVCSIHLQVLCGDGGDKLLLLAEGLLKKHIASHSLHEPEALSVYISILEQQAKYGDAMELLSGELGSLFMIEVDKLRIQGRLLARAGDFTAASSVFEKVLESCPDDWECFLHYLGCVLDDDSSWCDRDGIDPLHPPKVVKCKFSHLTEEMFDSRIAVASTLVHKLISDSNNDALRCPYLANLEIERRKHLFGKENDDLLMKAVIQYFVRFGHLACFSSDVEVFLQVLSNDKTMELLDNLKKNCDSTTVPKKVLGLSITLFKIQELLGVTSKLPASELQNSAVQMVKMFLKNLPLSKDLDPQESVLGEDLLTLASSLLVQLFSKTRHLGYLLEAIMILEFGLCLRRFVWPYKISLLHLYSYLDILSLAYEWYRSLDVKNILLESVSHHILPQMLQSHLWTDLSILLKEYLKFMDDHLRESADLTFLAYRHRTYSKVIEFVQFKERLQHSNQYLVAKIETTILQLKQNADNVQQEESILECIKYGIDFLEISRDIKGKALTFNEDMNLRPWWTPSPEKNYLSDPSEGVSCGPQEDLKEREQRIGRIIEKRSLLPRMIYLSIQCASASVKENTEVNGSLSHSDSFSELKLLLERYAKILGHSFSDATQLVLKVSNELQLSEVLETNIVDWVNFAVFLNAWNLNAQEVLLPVGDDGCMISTFNIVHSFLKNHILEKVQSMRALICSPGEGLPLLVQLVTEPLSWHCLVIQSFIRSSLPSGRKKKRSGASEQFKAPLSHAISDSIQFLSGVIKEVIRWLRQEINRPEEENVEVILSFLERKGQKEGPGEVFQLLEAFASSCQNEVELGNLLTESVKGWSSMNFARKVVSGQDRTLSEFLRICESKLNSLSTVANQMAQILRV